MTLSGLYILLGALAGAVGVGTGAFGAHALKASLGDKLPIWQTAVQYQLVHALALLGVALCLRQGLAGPLLYAGACFALGIVLFSGSLYGLALGGPRWLGPVTPMGGLAFIVGWVCLAAAAFKA